MRQTLYDKLFESHTVLEKGGQHLIYIDRHLLHEVTSPQAFENMLKENRKPWRRAANLAVPEHNVPTTKRHLGIDGVSDPISKLQIETLNTNCQKFDIEEISMVDPRQGIVHIMGAEQGAALPGYTIVCGDSHTSTHGAFAALAFGIGTSEVEHVLTTNCLWQKKLKNLKIEINGTLAKNVSAKDVVLYVIGKIGCSGGAGHAIEFTGSTISALSMEGRMTVCNMAIEAGARVGLIAVDEKTIDYVKDKPKAPKGAMLEQSITHWKTLYSDKGSYFDTVYTFQAKDIAPQVTWGTSPEMVAGFGDCIPSPEVEKNPARAQAMQKALAYHNLKPGDCIGDIVIDKVFIGSCTNSRIEDLRIAAKVVEGKKIASNIKLAMVVPGSGLIKKQAEIEGLDQIFERAGFEWRSAGCSMCLAMNDDKLEPGERCASTSNRNFEGRQGANSLTHLLSPASAAASALKGKLAPAHQN